MPQKIKISGVWKDSVPYLKVSDTWKIPRSIYNKINGDWKSSFLQNGINDDLFNVSDTTCYLERDARDAAIQSDGKSIFVGNFTRFNNTQTNRIVRINEDLSLDDSFKTNIGTGANSIIYSVSIQSDGKILIGGDLTSFNGTSVPKFARLNSNGTLDTAFNTNLGSGPNAYVYKIEFQSDGKILVAGNFTSFNGTTIARLARLNSDGTLDASFNTNLGTGFNSLLRHVRTQSDGKILVAGNFTSFNGTSAGRFTRLNSNGTLDTAFNTSLGTGSDGVVHSTAIQSDGKILVAGNFFNMTSLQSYGISRLNSDGTTDTGFRNNALNSFEDDVFAVDVQSDGKIYVGGNFSGHTDSGGTYTPGNYFTRLNSNGTLDTSFNTSIFPHFNSTVSFIKVKSDGKILIAGFFRNFKNDRTGSFVAIDSSGSIQNGQETTGFSHSIGQVGISKDGEIVVTGLFKKFYATPVNQIAKLNSNGILDTTFNTNIGSGFNTSNISFGNIKVQPDGKVIVAGSFISFNGISINRILRLNSNGTLDTAFNANVGTGLNSDVSDIFLQPDGKILIGSSATLYNGTAVKNLVRLNSDGTLDTTFNTSLGTGPDDLVRGFKIQPDGKILIVGNFTSFNGTAANYVTRLNSDGTLDTSFNTNLGTGADSVVNTVDIDANGKIYIAGFFTSFNGTPSGRFLRLNSNGTFDTTFNTSLGTGFNSIVFKVIVDESNGVIVLGGFTSFNTTTYYSLLRIKENGSIDTEFLTNLELIEYVSLSDFIIDSSKKITIVGQFVTFGNRVRSFITKIGGDIVE
jgi:uncharacterized delta-60 repeat protein